jgi:hypothetical protein
VRFLTFQREAFSFCSWYSPTVLRLVLFRPFIPVVVRNFSLYWRNKIIDWAPIPALRDLREIVKIMDKTSKDILAEKRADLVRGEKTGVFSARTKGKDILSIMCEIVSLIYRIFLRYLYFLQ